MRYRKLDVNGDYTFGGDQRAFYVNVPAAPAQAVKTRLGLELGEFFLDTSDGTNWRTGVLGRYTAAIRDDTLRARILGTPEVTGIASYSSSVDGITRTFNVSATIDTSYGQVKIEESR